eukprot:TRINITY_DN61311_c0_g1_i1.p1 TRINITY_DN61311_c0_g1~~TRINITY_DN61311_c0_g1_i1.p1  ORF type:complete len:410 (+),score=119.85 TRINITY_DN61311_c0_g1_i1:81-1232(+)
MAKREMDIALPKLESDTSAAGSDAPASPRAKRRRREPGLAPPRSALSPERDEQVFDQAPQLRRRGWPAGPPRLQYEVLAHSSVHEMALRLERADPGRFRYHPSKWQKFDEGGTDDICLGGLHPANLLRGRHVLFWASFHNNDVTLSQLYAFVTVLQSFVKSLTICLPFYPVGTMERVTTEGTVATANACAQLFAGLPHIGSPTRLMIYDLHTLQNRFYFSSSTVASLCSAVPLLLEKMAGSRINCIAFPDEGAAKRFGPGFPKRYPVVVCAKKRDGEKRQVVITEGDANGKHVVIVDDLVRTGGTLYEAAAVIKASGAVSVSCFVTHAVFPFESWRAFAKGGSRSGIFDVFWITNSVSVVTSKIPTDDVFEILDLTPRIIADL